MLEKIKNTLKGYQWKHLNIRLLFFVLALNILGIYVIDSASAGYGSRQIFGMVLGLVACLVLTLFSYKFVLKFYWIYYFLNLSLLIIVRFFGSINMGAKRWIELGSTGLNLQPSEFTKLFLILFFAALISKHYQRLNKLTQLFFMCVLLVIPVALILDQPDLSTSIVICLVFCVILFVAGISWKIIFGAIVAAVPLVAILAFLIMQPGQTILEDYQYNRIVGFYDETNEEAAVLREQQEQSVIAIGSGGLYGKGLNNNTVTSVKNGEFLSELHTDFIFAIVGEELGFVGCAVLILLLFCIIVECFIVGGRAADLDGKIIACSFASLIGIQSIINMAVVTMLIPNTGLTLPFVSYGISSLLSLYAGVGIVLNISMHKNS
ncbi:MAG: rod shape-determining protein RodA [Lachnospiraceae bacterium]|nr:rod shape-determining protein RodA [Lachnospiraceae bacterium]